MNFIIVFAYGGICIYWRTHNALSLFKLSRCSNLEDLQKI